MTFRQRRRHLGVESLENRMVLSGLGLSMKGIELPVDNTPAAQAVCVAKSASEVQAAKGAEASETAVKPFKVSGGGTAGFLPLDPSNPAPLHATGTATNLGNYTAEGAFKVDDLSTGAFSSDGPFVFTAANGDELHFTFEGSVELSPAPGGKLQSTWTATFTPVIGESTGRFAQVIGGSFTMIAKAGPFDLADQDIPYTWKGSGELEYGKSFPYVASGTGQYFWQTGDYGGSGSANLFGNQTYSGNVETTPTDNPLVLNFVNTAPQTIVTDNGDELYVTLSGQVTLIPQGGDVFTAVWSGDAVVEGGTGRFAKAKPGSEPMKVTAVNDPFTFADAAWNFTWTLEGPIVVR